MVTANALQLPSAQSIDVFVGLEACKWLAVPVMGISLKTSTLSLQALSSAQMQFMGNAHIVSHVV